jgi:hypothetical protein
VSVNRNPAGLPFSKLRFAENKRVGNDDPLYDFVGRVADL